ncbi:MAG: DUF2931 family protein, partial [Plesiomonas sp.]
VINMHRLVLLLLLPVITACQSSPQTIDWRYTVGSNADEIWHTKACFYRENKPIHSSSNGSTGFVGPNALKTKNYPWHLGAGRKLHNQPIPDQVEIEWISFHDKKRYSITLDLPQNLAVQMTQPYRLKVGNQWREESRRTIGLGLATGGYVEVLLRNTYVKPDILLARGLAKEIKTYQDKEKPLTQIYKEWFNDFDSEYREIYRQHPIPLGMQWAPIMDAYRATQPRTDQQPMK